MSDNITRGLWLIGAGVMAKNYAQVLNDMNIDFEIIGRGKASANNFKNEFNKVVRLGGLQQWLDRKNLIVPDAAIVAVGIEQLAEVTISLLENGCKRILVEKPAGMDSKQIQAVGEAVKKNGAEVYVAYNRRFYASAIKAKELISADGGVTSFFFEFTEWAHEIEKLKKADCVKKNWFLGNSSHVVDLAFYLGGNPMEISCYTAGGIKWHPKASIYAGAGVTEKGTLFSYQANWEAPGRWGVEILTRKNRFIFRPLEKLQVQKKGSVAVELIDIEDELDTKFKPGLYLQTRCFIEQEYNELCSITEHIRNLKYYDRINSSADQ
jgi:predicted dehydrogenase